MKKDLYKTIVSLGLSENMDSYEHTICVVLADNTVRIINQQSKPSTSVSASGRKFLNTIRNEPREAIASIKKKHKNKASLLL